MKYRRPSFAFCLVVQAAVFGAIAVGLASTPNPVVRWLGKRWTDESHQRIPISRQTALTVEPLYDDPSLVSDEELTMVLAKVRPAFSPQHLRPNYVEHALRTWGVRAKFADKRVLSGEQMLEFLTDHGQYVASWNGTTRPLLSRETDGVSVRWGSTDASGSVHHDHLLASLSEAGARLDLTVYPPGGEPRTFGDLLQQALRDFQLDEKETEWSAMAFALWLPPQTKSWKTASGRTITFDMLAHRLMRGDAKFGVCSGTHRVYSLVLLWRIDEQYDIFSSNTRERVRSYLKHMRDLVVASQFADGHWSSTWSRGRESVTDPVKEPNFKAVIATGHHLEWLAIAPEEFHPPRDVVRKGARWVVRHMRGKSMAEIQQHYTFYSHVGNALALWRKTHPADFWTALLKRRETARAQ